MTEQKKRISEALRNSVWNNYIGIEFGISQCFCCNLETISRGNFDCGHVVAEHFGGTTTLNNLRPICRNCNSSMRTRNMEEFMNQFGFVKCDKWYGKTIFIPIGDQFMVDISIEKWYEKTKKINEDQNMVDIN
jgi:hypothetical protein